MSNINFSITEKLIFDPIQKWRAPIAVGANRWKKLEHFAKAELASRIVALATSIFAALDFMYHFSAGNFTEAKKFAKLMVIGSIAGAIWPNIVNNFKKVKKSDSKTDEAQATEIKDDDSEYAKQVKNSFAECRKLFNTLTTDDDAQEFISQCAILAECIDAMEYVSKSENKPLYRENKQLLNAILNFKNKARATMIKQGEKVLKGPNHAQKLLKMKDQKKLKKALKSVRSAALKKHFKERLSRDETKLSQLWTRFNENKGKRKFDDCDGFLNDQLKRWQKKLDGGKPIAIPKWFHCTPEASTLDEILATFILYMQKKAFPGCFVSNEPATTFGGRCVALSDHIETTGTKDPDVRKSTIVYPKQAQMYSGREFTIAYSDQPIAPCENEFKDNQKGIGIWLGFQRGAKTMSSFTNIGTAGIPLKRIKRLQTKKPLKYYKDTTVAFIFSTDSSINLDDIANKNRVQVIKHVQQKALQKLISGTFQCTLPASWEGNIEHCW